MDLSPDVAGYNMHACKQVQQKGLAQKEHRQSQQSTCKQHHCLLLSDVNLAKRTPWGSFTQERSCLGVQHQFH
eukprot:1160793-Pelagomonas_calceolata.AAC.1